MEAAMPLMEWALRKRPWMRSELAGSLSRPMMPLFICRRCSCASVMNIDRYFERSMVLVPPGRPGSLADPPEHPHDRPGDVAGRHYGVHRPGRDDRPGHPGDRRAVRGFGDDAAAPGLDGQRALGPVAPHAGQHDA